MFINDQKKEFWRYNNITCSATPIQDIDTIGPDGRIMWNSALALIVSGKTEEHLEMLDIRVIRRLLKYKWTNYAKATFF